MTFAGLCGQCGAEYRPTALLRRHWCSMARNDPWLKPLKEAFPSGLLMMSCGNNAICLGTSGYSVSLASGWQLFTLHPNLFPSDGARWVLLNVILQHLHFSLHILWCFFKDIRQLFSTTSFEIWPYCSSKEIIKLAFVLFAIWDV